MKLSISKKITLLVAVSIAFVATFSSIGSAILLGSKMMHSKEDYLKLSTYTIVQETAMMNAENTKIEAVTSMLSDFKAKTGADVTIFAYDTRVFSTLGGAIGTKLDSTIWKTLQSGEHYFSKKANVNGVKYYAWYEPVMEDGECVGAIFAGQPADIVDGAIIIAMLNVLMIGVITGTLFTLVSMAVAKKIVMKLERLRMVIGTLTANDLSVAYPKYDYLRDEIEVISNEAVDFTLQLRGIVENIVDTSKELLAVSDELDEGIDVAKSSSSEISGAVENIADGAESQSQDTQSITVQSEKMGSNIDHIKGSMESLTEMAGRMAEVKEDTITRVQRVAEVSDALRGEVTAVNEQITVTSKSVEEIKGFVDVIKEIASQTNLLSLNASIESARAGEHGRGFAVVAEQVKKLAEQSSDSALEIGNTIETLLENYSVIVEQMARATHNIIEQSEQIASTQESFIILDKDIKDTVQQIQEVTRATEELDTMKNTVIDSICSLSAVCEENSASTEETTASMEELDAVIEQANDNAKIVGEKAKALSEAVKIFKL